MFRLYKVYYSEYVIAKNEDDAFQKFSENNYHYYGLDWSVEEIETLEPWQKAFLNEAIRELANDYVSNLLIDDEEVSCPFCDSDDLQETAGMLAEGHFIDRYLQCMDCGEKFQLTYNLSSASLGQNID